MEQLKHYNDEQKLLVIKEFLDSGESMETFQAKNGMGHCTLSRWMIKFGLSKVSPNEDIKMKHRIIQTQDQEKSPKERELESKVAQLEQELETEKLKSLAYNTMIDIAEKDLGIQIRKKSGAK